MGLAVGMIATALAAVAALALTLALPRGPVLVPVVALAFFCAVLSPFLGIASVARARQPASARRALVTGPVVAGLVAATFLVSASARDALFFAFQSLLVGTLFGPLHERVFGLLFPVGWLLLLAAATPARWLAVSGRVIAVLVAAIVLLGAPAYSRALALRTGDSMWPAAAELRGEPLPEMRLLDVEGAARSFDEFRGKLILINVWRTW